MTRIARLIAAPLAALALAACGDSPADANDFAGNFDRDYGREGGRFTIELVAGDGRAAHYIHGGRYGRAATLITEEHDPDAARLIRGREAERAYVAAGGDLNLPAPDPEDLKIKIFGLEIYGGPDGRDGGQVRINTGIPGGRNFSLDAAGNDDDGAAHLTFSGWDRRDTREYIDDIEDAPRRLREQMKDQLGL